MTAVENSTPKTRLLEVATWVWRAFSVSFAFFFMYGTVGVYLDSRGTSDFLLVIALYIAIVIILSLSTWAVQYISTGNKVNFFTNIHKSAFGSMPLYWWSLILIAYMGGWIAMLANRSSDYLLMSNDFAEGVGMAAAVILIGCIGRLIAPKKHRRIGHIFGIMVVGLLSVAAFHYYPDVMSPTP